MTEELIVKEEKGFRYVEVGEGKPVVLLHGLFGALSNWRTVIKGLRSAGEYKILVPILPLYDLPILNTNVGALSSFLHKFLQFKDIQKPILIGNSLGGHVALIYVLKHSDNVDKLILTGSSGLYENSFGGTFPKRENYDYVAERVKFTFYDPNTATEELVDEVFGIINDRGKVVRILSMAKSAIRHNLKSDLHKIKVPTCLIWGKHDNITPPEVAEEFNALIPNSELFWIDKCGHAPMMEHPEEFNSILKSFLQENANK